MSRHPHVAQRLPAHYWVNEHPATFTEGADLDAWNWTGEAACRGVDPELFFADKRTDRAYLLYLCAHCPVREACLQHALDHEESGWWGGMSQDERQERRRGTDTWPEPCPGPPTPTGVCDAAPVTPMPAPTSAPTPCASAAGADVHGRN